MEYLWYQESYWKSKKENETGFAAVYANVWMNFPNIPNRKIGRRQRQIGRSIVCSGLCHKFTFWGKLSQIPDLAINSHFAAKLDLWFHIGGGGAQQHRKYLMKVTRLLFHCISSNFVLFDWGVLVCFGFGGLRSPLNFLFGTLFCKKKPSLHWLH